MSESTEQPDDTQPEPTTQVFDASSEPVTDAAAATLGALALGNPGGRSALLASLTGKSFDVVTGRRIAMFEVELRAEEGSRLVWTYDVPEGAIPRTVLLTQHARKSSVLRAPNSPPEPPDLVPVILYEADPGRPPVKRTVVVLDRNNVAVNKSPLEYVGTIVHPAMGPLFFYEMTGVDSGEG